MNELKSFIVRYDGKFIRAYGEAEVNKLIVEKGKKIDELQKATDSAWSKVNAMYDELRRHKYKWCLAMAMWCESNNISLYSVVENNLWKYTSNYWLRWRNKWLELAEKFKEGK